MDSTPALERRALLKAAGSAAVLGTVAGCLGTDDTAPLDGGGTGFGWDQTHVDTQWLADADANDAITVEPVTTLERSGPGSLASALSAAESNRQTVVVFEVGGIIDTGGDTYIRSHADNVYIAGQTAPYPGVTMVRGGIRVHGSNTIVQHMTFLPGNDVADPNKSRAITVDDDGGVNVLFDHCAAGWAADTNINIQESTNVAVLNSINTEPMNNSSHSQGAPSDSSHGYGLYAKDNATNVSYIGNLQTHCWKRNLDPSSNTRITFANNYIYNWGERVYHGSEASSKTDWIQTVIEAGPDSSTVLSGSVFDANPGRVYWADNAVRPRYTSLKDGNIEYVASAMNLPAGLAEDDLVDPAALGAFLIPMVGPRPVDRAPFAQRVIDDFTHRTGRIIDDHHDVGGYPEYDAQTRPLEPPETDLLDWVQQYTDMVEQKSQ